MSRFVALGTVLTAALLAAVLFQSIGRATTRDELYRKHTLQAGSFAQWKAEQGKRYLTPAEQAYRFEAFLKSHEQLAQLQAQDLGYATHLGKFADLTEEEFQAKFTGLWQASSLDASVDALRQPAQQPLGNNVDVDWEREGKLGRVRDQRDCGSCYSFASSMVAQAFYAIKNKLSAVLEFSDQHIVDCTKAYGNNGCGGGLNEASFTFLADFGAMLRSAYPYTGEHDGLCKHDPKRTVKSHSGFVYLQNNPTLMLQALYAGPLAVGVDSKGLRFYKHGIITPGSKTCSDAVNHAVVIFGAGSYAGGKLFWRVRNSWGADWGENGNFRIHSDIGSGLCGVNKQVSYLT